MRRFVLPLVVLSLAAAPIVTKAGPLLELSLGEGFRASPSPTGLQKVNIMLTPGYSLLDGILKLELGLVGNLGDVEHSNFDLNIRPMVVVSPPFVPLYLRAIFAIEGLTDGPTTVAYGGALGTSFGLAGVSLFAELGILPRTVHSTNYVVLEGRVGAGYAF